MINFLVLAALLRRFLFKPITAMIAKRQQDLARAAEEAERARHEADELRARADKALAEIDAEMERRRVAAAALSTRDREVATAEARREADAIREAGRRDIESERDKAAETMASGAVELGGTIARRLLEQIAAPSIAEAFLTRLCDHLDALSPDRLRELVKDLEGGELLLATAPLLKPDDADRWLARITTRLGNRARPRLVGDDSLIAGAELRFPHSTLSYCWRDGVDAAREELAHDARGG